MARTPVPNVEASFSAIKVRLFPFEEYDVGGRNGDYYRIKPWGWSASCKVTFWFGKRQRSKWITQGYSWSDWLGWPKEKPPSSSALEGGRIAVVNNLVRVINDHGFDFTVDDFDVQVIIEPWVQEQLNDYSPV